MIVLKCSLVISPLLEDRGHMLEAFEFEGTCIQLPRLVKRCLNILKRLIVFLHANVSESTAEVNLRDAKTVLVLFVHGSSAVEI